jgi:cytochrome bd ubiquinol oxidase subunit II
VGLQQWWFVALAALFVGFFVLEGFDFGVGMLMAPMGRVAAGDPEQHRRAVLNTIGPVWDGNEVWLIVAGGSMFAAFPGWYAAVFSSLYVPLLLILVGMIVRVVAIEWRGKIDDPRWRSWADAGIAVGSWLPAILWGTAFAVLVRGLPVDADARVHPAVSDVINAYTLLGGLAICGLFLLHGAVFIALKTSGAVHDDGVKFAQALSLPVTVVLVAFGLWTQLAHGKNWTWLLLAAALIAQATAVALVWRRTAEGWVFLCTSIVVAAVVAMMLAAMYPNLVPSTLNPNWSLTIYNASSTPYTLKIMSWLALIAVPPVIASQAWTYWVFRRRISADGIPPSIGLSSTWRS